MTQPTPGRSAPVAGVVLLAAFLLATLVPVLTGFDQLPRKSIDHDRNHVPVIRTFAEAWPSPDLTDYDSATTPGMHLIMAAATRVFGDSETMLQCLSSLFGAGLILAAWWFASRTAGGTVAAWCVLPIACSPYVLGNAIWVMTDNLALATIAITAGISIFIQPSGRSGTTSAIALIASVCIRQINVWPSAVAAVVPWLAATPIRRRLPFHDTFDRRFSRTAAVAGAIGIVGAFAVLGWFAWLWGGLVPPAFQPGGDGAAHIRERLLHRERRLEPSVDVRDDLHDRQRVAAEIAERRRQTVGAERRPGREIAEHAESDRLLHLRRRHRRRRRWRRLLPLIDDPSRRRHVALVPLEGGA